MLSVNLLCELALQGFPVGYFTPAYKLLKGTFNECVKLLDPVIAKKSDQEFIELVTGGVLDFWSLDNPYAGRSRKYKRSIIDEGAFAKSLWESWTQSIRPTLTDLKGDAFFFSTPRGKNDFFKIFMMGKQGDSNWASWQMSTYTNPFIDPTEIDEAKKDLPALAFSQEYMAEFNDNIANPFGYDFIRLCAIGQSSLPAVCFGIDLAKSSDWTVIIGLDQFGQVCHFDRFQKDWQQTVQAIKLLPNVTTQMDSTGVGDPITEQIQINRGNVIGKKFTQTSKQQIMEGLAVAIQQRKILFPEGHIKDELENFEFVYTRTGVKYSAPQGLHDDCVCALALAWDIHKGASQSGSYSWV